MKTDLEVVDEAIKLLEPTEGWIKGLWCVVSDDDQQMSYCAEGALLEAIDGFFTSRIEDIVAKGWYDGNQKTWSWEDADETVGSLTGEELTQYRRIKERLARIYKYLLPAVLESIPSSAVAEQSREIPVYNDSEMVNKEDVMLGFKYLREELANES